MLSRRTFLKNAVTLAAAPQLTSPLLSSSNKKKLGYALVGLGRLSTNQIAPALAKCEYSELVGIVTGSPEKAEKWTKQYGIKPNNVFDYRNFDSIANSPDIDVVYIVLPNSMHEEFTIRAARAGKHVLCEKPMALTSDEAREMIAECKKANVKLAIGYRCQFEPHHQECIRIAQAKELGQLRQIDASFGFKMGDYPLGDLRRWRLEREYAGGGALMDVGIYAVQAARYLTGEEPVSVMAREIKTDPVKFAEVDETILWSMTFPSGTCANCSTTYNFNGLNSFTAYADKGKFGMNPAYGYGGNKGFVRNKPLEKPQIDQFAAQMDSFSQIIERDEQSIVSGEEGLRDMLVLEAIYQAVQCGTAVEVAKV